MFAHDHDEAYNEYKREDAPLWDGNEDGDEPAASADGGLQRPAAAAEAGKAGMHTGWVYGAVLFTLVAITAVTVLLFLSSGHLQLSGTEKPEGDNRVKSVNRNSAGINNSPKAHAEIELGARVRWPVFLEDAAAGEGGKKTAPVVETPLAA